MTQDETIRVDDMDSKGRGRKKRGWNLSQLVDVLEVVMCSTRAQEMDRWENDGWFQEAAWNMLKRLIRHLVGHGRLVQVISEQKYVKAPRVDTDGDYAGCALTRKSTTGAHLSDGFNLLKAGSWTQGTGCKRVAESELYAGVKGASVLL